MNEDNKKDDLIEENDKNNNLAINESRVSDLHAGDKNHIITEGELKTEFSKYGIVIVIIFFLLNFINGMHWITFAACAAKFGKFYHLTNFEVDILSLMFMVLYFFSTYTCSWLIDQKSMKLGLCLAACSLILGSILKIFLFVHISFAYIGQFFTALLQPAILNSPAKIAATWFNEKYRVLVTSICCISNTIGVMFGYIAHTFIMEENTVNPKIYKNDFINYLIVEASITTIFGLSFIFLMKEKPKNPPSNSQRSRYKINGDNDEKKSSWDEVKKLFKNNNFIYLFVSLSCVVGYVNILATIFNSYMALYKISDTHASYISGIANFFGIFTAIIISVLIDRFKKYKTILLICNLLAIVFIIITTIVLESVKSKNLYLTIGTLFTLVFGFAIPIYSSGMDFVCEITYGIGESTSNGVIMFGNQFVGIIGIIISNLFRAYLKHAKYLTNVFCIFLLSISLFCLYMVNQELKRTEEDNKKGNGILGNQEGNEKNE